MTTENQPRPAEKSRGPAGTEMILGGKRAEPEGMRGRLLSSFLRKQYRRLLALRTRLEYERQGHAAAARQALESFSMDMADSATEAVDHDLVLGELSAEQDALYEINEALNRIANGTYGICELTRRPIPPARLAALPWTRFTQEAERDLERSGASGRPHLGELRSVLGRAKELPPEAMEPGEESPEPVPVDEALYSIGQIPGAPWPLHPQRRIPQSRRRPGAQPADKKSRAGTRPLKSGTSPHPRRGRTASRVQGRTASGRGALNPDLPPAGT